MDWDREAAGHGCSAGQGNDDEENTVLGTAGPGSSRSPQRPLTRLVGEYDDDDDADHSSSAY